MSESAKDELNKEMEYRLKKRGRPRKASCDRRTETISFAVTKEEYDSVCRRAEIRKETISEYMRTMLADYIFVESNEEELWLY